MLGVEARCLHAESAEGGPVTVPVHVFTQQTLAALSCQPSGSITFTLKSLQCVFMHQSLHCSLGRGQHLLRFTAGAGMQFCSFQQFPPHSSRSKTGTLFSGNALCHEILMQQKEYVLPHAVSASQKYQRIFPPPPSKRDVLHMAQRHRVDGGAMD